MSQATQRLLNEGHSATARLLATSQDGATQRLLNEGQSATAQSHATNQGASAQPQPGSSSQPLPNQGTSGGAAGLGDPQTQRLLNEGQSATARLLATNQGQSATAQLLGTNQGGAAQPQVGPSSQPLPNQGISSGASGSQDSQTQRLLNPGQSATARLLTTNQDPATQRLLNEGQSATAQLLTTNRDPATQRLLNEGQSATAQLLTTNQDPATQRLLNEGQSATARLLTTNQDPATQRLLNEGQSAAERLLDSSIMSMDAGSSISCAASRVHEDTAARHGAIVPKERSRIAELPSEDITCFRVCVHGEIESGHAGSRGSSALMCVFSIQHGADWTMVSGAPNGITQLAYASASSVASVASTPRLGSQREVVWNFPIGVVFKSTSPFGWPRLVVTVYGTDLCNRRVVKGYGSVHVPCQPGRHKRTIRLYCPMSSSPITRLLGMLFGNPAQLVDPRILAETEGREVIRVQSGGAVRVNFEVLLKDTEKFNYSF